MDCMQLQDRREKNFLLDNEPSFSVEYTKHGNPKPGSYDRADSLVIAKAGHILRLDDDKR